MSLKRSASNRLVDFSGFEGHKRRPVYNKKYITKAKRNIAESNYDEDEYNSEIDENETIEPASRNRMMYRDMVERDKARKKKEGGAGNRAYREAVDAESGDYPNLSESRQKIDKDGGKSTSDMQKELAEIKKMLSENKKEMVKYRCPMQKPKDPLQPSNNRGQSSHAPSLSNSIGIDTAN